MMNYLIASNLMYQREGCYEWYGGHEKTGPYVYMDEKAYRLTIHNQRVLARKSAKIFI